MTSPRGKDHNVVVAEQKLTHPQRIPGRSHEKPVSSGGRAFYPVQISLLAAAYSGAAKLGLMMAFVAEPVTAVWLPTGIALAAQLLGHDTWPSEAAVRAERKIRLQEALNSLDPLDREVLALRHFEQLNNAETAQTLGLHESAASKRYIRALKKLKDILTSLPGGGEGV